MKEPKNDAMLTSFYFLDLPVLYWTEQKIARHPIKFDQEQNTTYHSQTEHQEEWNLDVQYSYFLPGKSHINDKVSIGMLL